jgi:hypothetical protein
MAADKFPYGGIEYNQEISRLSKVHESQIWGYLKKTYENEKYNFWLLMARDFQSEFKAFIISHGYDGIFADEQLKDPYDIKDPSQFTNTFIIFDASQVKLADGRNLKFDPMSADIRYEDGGEITSNLLKVGDKVKLRRLPIYYRRGDIGAQKESIKVIKKIIFVREKDVDPLEYNGVSKKTHILAITKDKLSIEFYYHDNDLVSANSDNARYEPVYEDGGFMEKGAQLDMPYTDEVAPEVLLKGGKMRELLLSHKYKSGGALHNEEGVKDDAKEGGLFVGQSHSDGGIKAYNFSTQQPIEVEGGEIIITKKAVDDGEKREFEGEMLTNKEILSRINESGGGVSFADGGEIHGCGCSGKKYNYGGETLEDFMIIKRMNDAYGMTIGKSVSYVNSLVNKLK